MSDLIFISVSNYKVIELTKNHLETLKQNGISNYMSYVTDEKSYEELTRLGFNSTIYNVDNSNIEDEKNKMDFENDDYNYIMYIRYYVITDLLKQGKIVWYLDIDTVALIDLNIIYNTLDKPFDLYFQNDINMLCTGCMLIFPNNKTITLIDAVIKNKNDKINDQLIMNQLLINNPNVFNIHVLSECNFPNGTLYFNELNNTNMNFRQSQTNFKNSNEPVYFVHANYIIGIDNKIVSLKQKNLWFI
jgi:hypothetical protein